MFRKDAQPLKGKEEENVEGSSTFKYTEIGTKTVGSATFEDGLKLTVNAVSNLPELATLKQRNVSLEVVGSQSGTLVVKKLAKINVGGASNFGNHPQFVTDEKYKEATLNKVESFDTSEKDDGDRLQLSETANPLIEETIVEGVGENRGMALIVPLIMYWDQKDRKWAPRHGAEEDIKILKKTFGDLGMRVFCPERVTAPILKWQITGWLSEFKEKFQKKPQHAYSIVVVMGHGQENDILLDSYCNGMSIQKEIFDKFDNHNFEAMAEKPKMFIMQCCRGDKPVKPYRNKMDSQCIGHGDDLFEEHSGELAGQGAGRQFPGILAGISDSLIIWSTVEGAPSFRDELTGSHFIQIFCQIVGSYVQILKLNPTYTKDLYELLLQLKYKFRTFSVKMGAQPLAGEDCDEGGQKEEVLEYTQPPQIVDTLFHRFIFKLDGQAEYMLQ